MRESGTEYAKALWAKNDFEEALLDAQHLSVNQTLENIILDMEYGLALLADRSDWKGTIFIPDKIEKLMLKYSDFAENVCNSEIQYITFMALILNWARVAAGEEWTEFSARVLNCAKRTEETTVRPALRLIEGGRNE